MGFCDPATTVGQSRGTATIMDVTILRLPHMQVVLNEQEGKDREEEREEGAKRRRLDSSGQELGSGSEETPGETKRREPAHRRKNRQRVKQQQKQHNALAPPYVYDDAEIEALQQEGGMERSMIEELLKKYGFGRWTKPEEVWKGRNISRLSEIPESAVSEGSS